jgi:hypothetical protein
VQFHDAMRAPRPLRRPARPERLRVSLFDDAGGGLPLPLPARRTWIAGLAVAILFVVFASVAVRQVAALRGPRLDTVVDVLVFLFQVLWVLGWSVGVVLLFLLTIVLLFYRESARIGAGRLIHVARVGPLRVFSEYDLDRVRNLRVVGIGKDGGRIRFDYGDADRGLGNDMTRVEAERRVRMIQSAIDKQGAPRSSQPMAAAAPGAPVPPPRGGTSGPTSAPRTTVPPVPPAAAAAPGGSPLSAPARWSPSTLALLGANLIPLAGVLLLRWNLGQVMVLFWAENAVVGFYNLIKLVLVARWSALVYGPFFTAHYGGFMAGHFVFIYYLFVRGVQRTGPEGPAGTALAEVFVPLWPALAALLVSHGVSFVTNFLGRREYVDRDVRDLMSEPYKRVIILHVTIIIGGGLILILGSPLPALLLLVVLKTVVDAQAHRTEHRRAGG